MARRKNTLIYSRKLSRNFDLNFDTQFQNDVLETLNKANNQEQHIELLEEIYPNYTIEPLYTYEHGGFSLDRFIRCQWDSSADAFCAYKKEEQLEKEIKNINKLISY